jgi:hypothetical protein
VYDLLTTQDQPHLHQNSELIWHKQVPLKVSIFAWRLLRDRLPTKENLAKRGIISVDSQMCCAGCKHVEDLKHLFLICPYYGALWPLVRAWLGIEGVKSQVISDHFAIYPLCWCFEIAEIIFSPYLAPICLDYLE